jgi:hypothetical protein
LPSRSAKREIIGLVISRIAVSRRQHRANFRRPKPALMEKRRQKWRRDPERREHCAIENQEAIERPKLYSSLG